MSIRTLRHYDENALQRLHAILPFRGLADMYDGGGDFTRSIDKAGGSGAAAFRIYCQRAK